MEIRTPKELADNITDFVNTCGNDKNDEFIEAMKWQHRTLQQSFTRLCLRWLEDMASREDHQIDLRNQASRDVARKLLTNSEALADFSATPSKYLPTI